VSYGDTQNGNDAHDPGWGKRSWWSPVVWILCWLAFVALAMCVAAVLFGLWLSYGG